QLQIGYSLEKCRQDGGMTLIPGIHFPTNREEPPYFFSPAQRESRASCLVTRFPFYALAAVPGGELDLMTSVHEMLVASPCRLQTSPLPDTRSLSVFPIDAGQFVLRHQYPGDEYLCLLVLSPV
ncbi:hypothetical protein AB0282_11220, partial [Pseudarthrobacter oxydans]|uniref:hypothetical protein n=1 Tax=Pseudarthrobacter oxydans TaxID=1671 RepID=UPI00344E230E